MILSKISKTTEKSIEKIENNEKKFPRIEKNEENEN